jgi:hypothetical protein
MKLKSTQSGNRIIFFALSIFFVLIIAKSSTAQVTASLGSPITFIYGLTSNGEIYEINSNTAATHKTIKNNSYSGNSPSSANGLAYNTVNGKFYYFKRNVTSSPQEFVSFSPSTNTVTILATSTCSDDVHTGCISFDGKGYYTVDIQGNLNYYNIAANTWTKITSNIVDQFNADVDAVVRTQSAGDMAIDGYGQIWFVTSSNTNYGVYKLPAPMPTTAVAKLTVSRVIAPTASTPSGNSIAGVAFNANGQLFLGTRGDDKLWLLQNSSTLTFVGNFTNSDAGNDLTSQNFPIGSILPVKWVSFNASVENKNEVSLSWDVIEQQNQGFYVQHSQDGNKWENITFIKSKKVPEIVAKYSYSYTADLSGKQYYRIEQVDVDGKQTYTEVRTITLNTDGLNMAVWPNPAKNNINIDNKNTKTDMVSKAQLFDFSGRMSMEKQLQPGVNSIDISSLPAGTYLVKANINNGNSFIQKIIKQ